MRWACRVLRCIGGDVRGYVELVHDRSLTDRFVRRNSSRSSTCFARRDSSTSRRLRSGPRCWTKTVYYCSIRTMYRHPGRERRGQGAPESAAPSELPEARAAGRGTQSGLELGHHEASRPGQVDLLLPVRDPGHLQPLRRGLDGRPSRERCAGQASDLRDLQQAGHHARTADDPRRPWVVDAQQDRGLAAERPGRGQEPLAASRLQRQPVLGIAVQDA